MTYPNLHSPQGRMLMTLMGEADDIDLRGEYLKGLGETMESTATSLQKIGEGTHQISKAVDKVREAASEIHGDLSGAATRYTGTGEALVAYAEVLRTAKTNIDPLVDEIQEAHESVRTAMETRNDAQRTVSDYNTTWFWEEEATDEQKTAAQSDLDDADTALTNAQSTLDGLWEDFDTYYTVWEEGYDSAVSGIETAIADADNDDGWFADLMKILNAICIVLTVVALFVSGPIAGAILVVVTVVAVVQLASDIYALSQGEGSWGDVAVGAVGLLPFGRLTRIAGRGGHAFAAARGRGGQKFTEGLRAFGRGSGRQSIREAREGWRSALAAPSPRSLPTRNPVTGLMDPNSRVLVEPTMMNRFTDHVYGLTHPQNIGEAIDNASTLNGYYNTANDNLENFVFNRPYNEANAPY